MRGDDPFYLRCGATLKHFYGNNQEKDRVRTSSSIDPRNKKEYYLEPFRRAVEAGAETVAYGLKAGVDCFTDDGKAVEAAAREALERGLITWEDVDRSIRNSFRTRIRLGLYDRQGDNPYCEIPEERLNSPEHTALARKAVRESAVLLKNEAAGSVPAADPGAEKKKRFLPLEPGQKIAVIGPWADVVIYAAGCNPVINSKEEIDREDLDMPRAQEEQLLEIASINPRTMLLLICNYPYAIGRIQEEIPAILQCASGSQELGNGLADLLFGKASPAGRLPMTWYRSTKDLPPMEDYDIIRGKRTYQYFDRPVLYPFGYGLSYTEFAYSGLDVTLEEPEGKEKTLRISLIVKNTGTTVSDEVVQIYVRQNNSRAPRPRKQLKAFERAGSLPPEEERRVEFRIPLKELEYYDVVTERMVLEEGSYTILAGASSEDIRLERTLSIGGVKIPPRNAESVTKADHYDDCKGAVLYQGHDSKCAVYAKTETAELLYRDFVFEKTPRKIHVLF